MSSAYKLYKLHQRCEQVQSRVYLVQPQRYIQLPVQILFNVPDALLHEVSTSRRHVQVPQDRCGTPFGRSTHNFK